MTPEFPEIVEATEVAAPRQSAVQHAGPALIQVAADRFSRVSIWFRGPLFGFVDLFFVQIAHP